MMLKTLNVCEGAKMKDCKNVFKIKIINLSNTHTHTQTHAHTHIWL